MRKAINRKQAGCILFLGLLPLISCILKLAIDGRTFADFYLSATIGNDEVFYYKYVEGVIQYGHPLGFFGFNESRSIIGGGTAWSPVISLYWIIAGKLFGWNYLTPMLCNLAVMSIAMLVFGIVIKPNMKQTMTIAILYLCYGQLAYYTLSGVPECIHYSLVILFMAGVIKCMREYHKGAVVLSWIAAFFLTLMRPYYILFFVLLLYLTWERGWKKAIAFSGAGIFVSGVLFGLLTKYMTTSYFGQSVLTRALNPEDFAGGPWNAFKNLVKTGLYGINQAFYWMKEAFLSGSFQGRMLIALVVMFLLVCFLLWKKRTEKKINVVLIFFVLYFPIRFAAAIYLYDKNLPPEAIRHAYDFILAAGLLIAVIDIEKKELYAMCTIAALALLVTQLLLPLSYPSAEGNSLDYAAKEEMQAIELAKQEFHEIFTLKEGEISYDNSIIWVFVDEVEGERTLMEWKSFYGIPAGMALNICFPDYVIENFDRIQIPYIATVPEGDVAKVCRENDAKLLYHSEDMEIYDVHQ